MTLAGTYRLPVSHLESRQRHPWKWTTLAENRWTHDGRKLTEMTDYLDPVSYSDPAPRGGGVCWHNYVLSWAVRRPCLEQMGERYCVCKHRLL